MEGLMSGLLRGQGHHGPGAAGLPRDGLRIPVSDYNYVVAFADAFASDYVVGDRMMAAIVEPTPVPAADSAMPPIPGLTAASMIDLKGLTRPEKFDGMDDHWLEWKDSLCSVMNLLKVTPCLDAIERMTLTEIELTRCTPPEEYLIRLLYTVLTSCFVFRLVPNVNGFEGWRHFLIEYEPCEPARWAAMLP
eukprot:12433814-Heterocapsa_arctica.AAC.1